ncbi:MAG: virulence factor SrfB [Symbiopectobacterium sp.]
MANLFGNAGRIDGQSTLRQQSTLQILMPIGRAIFEAYEGFDPLDMSAELEASFGELLPQRPTGEVLDYLNGEIQHEQLADAAAFDIGHTPLIVRLSKLHGEFLSNRISITQNLRSLCEVVALYDCDVLLLTGRPSHFPSIISTVPLPSAVAHHPYRVTGWLPHQRLVSVQ